MKAADLSALIDTHGAAIEDWPAADRAAARAMLASSAGARALLADAEAIEAALRSPPAGEDAISPGRIEGVLSRVMAEARATAQAPARAPSRARLEWRWLVTELRRNWLRYSVPMAVGAALGVVVGYSSIERAAASGPEARAGIVTLLEALYSNRLFGS